jgi:hypothetical protein
MLIFSSLVIGAIGIFGLTKMNWFYMDKEPIDYKVNEVPYTTQLKVTDLILKNTKGQAFSLKRIGMYDYFANDFADNYIYLLTERGAKIDTNSKNTYTIIEGTENYKNLGIPIFSENDVYVFKSQL